MRLLIDVYKRQVVRIREAYGTIEEDEILGVDDTGQGAASETQT